VVRNSTDPATTKVSVGGGRALGLVDGVPVQSIEIRERRARDGFRNVVSLSGLTAAAPFLVAALAIVPGILWPAPSGNDAVQVDAIWQKMATNLAGSGTRSGLLSSLTEPLTSGRLSQRAAEAKAVGDKASAELTVTEKQVAAVEATFSRTTARKQRDHNRAVTAQVVLAAVLALILSLHGARRIFKEPRPW
jgi:hypothetical protein